MAPPAPSAPLPAFFSDTHEFTSFNPSANHMTSFYPTKQKHLPNTAVIISSKRLSSPSLASDHLCGKHVAWDDQYAGGASKNTQRTIEDSTTHCTSNAFSSSLFTSDPLLPYALLPPLAWVIKPLTVSHQAVLLPSSGHSPKQQPTHCSRDPPIVSGSFPPSSYIAARQHPPLLRHLLDTSVPPPSCMRLPPSIKRALFATESGPFLTSSSSQRRRLSAPATSFSTVRRASLFTIATTTNTTTTTNEASIDLLSTSASHKASTLAVAETISDDRTMLPTTASSSHTTTTTTTTTTTSSSTITTSSSVNTHNNYDNGEPVDDCRNIQRANSVRCISMTTAASSAEKSVEVGRPHYCKNSNNTNEKSFTQRRYGEDRTLGPLLRSHCCSIVVQPTKRSTKHTEAIIPWRERKQRCCPTVFIPPFFSSPAALQRSDSTLQSELASSILRCRAAEIQQGRLYHIAAAVVYQAVRVHANRIADLVEMYGAAAAIATLAPQVFPTTTSTSTSTTPMTFPLPFPGPPSSVHTGRRLDTASAHTYSRLCQTRNGDKFFEAPSPLYYADDSILHLPAEHHSGANHNEEDGPLQYLPVIVAPAGVDVADHRLAVHGLLRECERRSYQTNSNVDIAEGLGVQKQTNGLFYLRTAVVKPTHCSSVGRALHAIYEQLTQTASLSSRVPVPTCAKKRSRGWSNAGTGGGRNNSQLRQETTAQRGIVGGGDDGSTCKENTLTDITNSLDSSRHNERLIHNVSMASKRCVASSCYDSGAAAAWGDDTWVTTNGVFARTDARQQAEVLNTSVLELEQLLGRHMWGEGAATELKAKKMSMLSVHDGFWNLDDDAATTANTTVNTGGDDAEQQRSSNGGGSDRRSPFFDSSSQQHTKDKHVLQSVSHEQEKFDQQQQHPGCQTYTRFFLEQEQHHHYDQPQFQHPQHHQYHHQSRRHTKQCRESISPLKGRGSLLSYDAASSVRHSGESGTNVFEKLARWWATQQQQLLLRLRLLLRESHDIYNDGFSSSVTAFHKTSAPAISPQKLSLSSGRTGYKEFTSKNWCGPLGVSTRAAAATSCVNECSWPPHKGPLEVLPLTEKYKEYRREEQQGETSEHDHSAAHKDKTCTKTEGTNDEANKNVKTDDQNNDDVTIKVVSDLCAKRQRSATNSVTAALQASDSMPSATAILIILEEAEAFPGGILIKLLQMLALLRQQHSIPFVVVATASTSATVLQQLCDAPLSSSYRLTVEPATLLQPGRVQQQLLQLLLCCPAALPFTLPLAAAEKLLRHIEEVSPSVLQLLRRLQLLLRLFYQHHPLAFLCRGLDGLAALMLPPPPSLLNEGEVSSAAAVTIRLLQQQQSNSSSTAATNVATATSAVALSHTVLCSEEKGGDARKKKEVKENDGQNCSAMSMQDPYQTKQQQEEEDILNSANKDSAGGPARSNLPRRRPSTWTTLSSASAVSNTNETALHAVRVAGQLRRRVELLAFVSLTDDHVQMLRQLLRHTNEVFIHLAAAQQEALLFFDKCCWQQVQLQRQHQRRLLLAAAAAASNNGGVAPPHSSSLLPPLQRDAAASALTLRCRPPREDSDPSQQQQQQPQQQFITSNERGGRGLTPLLGGPRGATTSPIGSSSVETVGAHTSVTEDNVRRKVNMGCRRSAGCVARQSVLGLLRSWWGGRGLLLLQKIEEEEKEQRWLQQRQQYEAAKDQQPELVSPGMTGIEGTNKHGPRGGGVVLANDNNGGDNLASLRFKLLCKEVLPTVSLELLQRRIGSCVACRLLLVLHLQLQRVRRLASAATIATDAEVPAMGGGEPEAAFTRAATAGSGKSVSADDNVKHMQQRQQQEQAPTAATEEEDIILLRTAAEEEANNSCRQTIETLDLLIGAHEEFSCFLRKCKPHTRVQEMAKACFKIEQDMRRTVTSLYEQFAVAAPVRVSAAIGAATHTPESLADSAALLWPLKVFRAQVKREAYLLRLLAAAEQTQQQLREQQIESELTGANRLDATAIAASLPPPAYAHATTVDGVKACDSLPPQQQQLPYFRETLTTTHASEVVRILDALDTLIQDLCQVGEGPAVVSSSPPPSDGVCVDIAPTLCSAAQSHVFAGEKQGILTGGPSPPFQETAILSRVALKTEGLVGNNTCSNNSTLHDTETVGGQHRRARISSHGGGTISDNAAAARQRRKSSRPAVGALRAQVTLKRKFIRWVEEALLLLLLPLPGWHPLGGELGLWGGSLGFEVVTASLQSPPGATPHSSASSDNSTLLRSSVERSGYSVNHKKCAASTPSCSTLAAAADLVCSSFEAASQTETLQHAAMGSTSFLECFSFPLDDEEEENESKEGGILEAEEASYVSSEAQVQQQRQKRWHRHSHQSSQVQEESSSADGRRQTGEREAVKRERKCLSNHAEKHDEAIKLEDVAILLRLINNAGRRINLWDLFCAFCRDLLRDRFKKKMMDMEKKRQQSTCTVHGENKMESDVPSYAHGSSCSPTLAIKRDSPSQRSSRTVNGRVTRDRSNQPQHKRHKHRESNFSLEEEILRLMEAESSSSFRAADTSGASHEDLDCWEGSTSPASSLPLSLSEDGKHASKYNFTSDDSERKQAISSRSIKQAHCGTTRVVHKSGDTSSRSMSVICQKRHSVGYPAFTAKENLHMGDVVGADDSLSNIRGQLPGNVIGESVPCTLLQQLQLRFAVAIETLDHQLGMIRLPSAASAAAAVERIMLAEDGEEDAVVIPDFSVVPSAEEQAARGDKITSGDEELEEDSEEPSEVSENDEEGSSATKGAADGTEQAETRSSSESRTDEAVPSRQDTEKAEKRHTRRSGRLGLAACGRTRSGASPSEEYENNAEENEASSFAGDDMLTHELKTMRKLLRNLFARRTHFVPIFISPEEGCDESAIESEGEMNVVRVSDEEVEERILRRKSYNTRRKTPRRTRKRPLL